MHTYKRYFTPEEILSALNDYHQTFPERGNAFCSNLKTKAELDGHVANAMVHHFMTDISIERRDGSIYFFTIKKL